MFEIPLRISAMKIYFKTTFNNIDKNDIIKSLININYKRSMT